MASADAVVRLLLETHDFDSKLVKSKRGMKDLESGGSSLGSVLKGVMGTFGKFAGALGIATTAGEAFRKVINGSEYTADAFASTMQQATSVVDGFFSSISNGNLSSFISDLQGVCDSAREAYEAMDELGSYQARFNPYSNAMQQQIDTLLAESKALSAKGDKQGALAKTQQATELSNRLQKASSAEGKMTERSAYATIRSLLKQGGFSAYVTNAMIKQLADPTRWEQTQNLANTYKYRMDRIAELKKGGNSVNGIGYGWEGATRAWEANRLEKEQKKDLRGWVAYTFQGLRDDQENGATFLQALNGLYGGINATSRNRAIQARIDRASARYSKTTTRKPATPKTGPTGPTWTDDPTTLKQMADNISLLESKIKTVDKSTEDYTARVHNLGVAQKEYNNELIRQKDLISWAQGKIAKPADMGLGTDLTAFNNAHLTLPEGSDKLSEDAEKEIKRLTTGGKDVKESWQDACNAIGDVGSALASVGSEDLNVAGTIMQAVAQVALGFARAVAGEGKSGNVWEWIAAAVSGTATMVATIASIHSSTGYADGGVVPGTSYSGDRLYSRLNSGEVVLNQGQIARANALLDNRGGGSSYISGEQIVTVINAYGRRTHKGEILK